MMQAKVFKVSIKYNVGVIDENRGLLDLGAKSQKEKYKNEDGEELERDVFGYGDFCINQSDFYKYYKFLDLMQIVDVDVTGGAEINYDQISDMLSDAILEKFSEKQNVNNRIDVYQPNNPLFHFNKVDFKCDLCTEELQGILDKGWSIIAICPQPDQRRPDYILGRYVKCD
jgi:hypothetical protein